MPAHRRGGLYFLTLDFGFGQQTLEALTRPKASEVPVGLVLPLESLRQWSQEDEAPVGPIGAAHTSLWAGEAGFPQPLGWCLAQGLAWWIEVGSEPITESSLWLFRTLPSNSRAPEPELYSSEGRSSAPIHLPGSDTAPQALCLPPRAHPVSRYEAGVSVRSQTPWHLTAGPAGGLSPTPTGQPWKQHL